MKYSTSNVELEPRAHYHGQFEVVLSPNCVHATRNLPCPLTNIDKLLYAHEFVVIVVFSTRLVSGLLESLWRFDDGREYVLARPEFWDSHFRESGFQHVSWTGTSTCEIGVTRLVSGFK